MKSCLDCKHCHVTKDCEFWLEPEDQRKPNVPCGRCFINIDLYWCSRPDEVDSNFAVLSFGAPAQSQKGRWLQQLASICSDFCAKE